MWHRFGSWILAWRWEGTSITKSPLSFVTFLAHDDFLTRPGPLVPQYTATDAPDHHINTVRPFHNNHVFIIDLSY